MGEDPNDIEKNPNAQIIFGKIKDLCVSMKAEDWLTMPPKIEIVTPVVLSAPVMSMYKQFQKEQVLSLVDREDLTVTSAVALSNKLLQFCNGAVYVDDQRNYTEIHNAKIEYLRERLEAADGNPVLVAYSFRHDVERIMKHMKSFRPKLLAGTGDVKDWNEGKIPVALVHPASWGHGVNLQFGGHLIENFGMTWDLELKLQFIARLYRQGQKHAVISNSLACAGTIDYRVIERVAGKESGQNAMMRALKAIIKEVIS